MTMTLPGTFNFRDLGGHATVDGGFTRRGILMRSDAPAQIGEAGREAVGELGIRTAIDLREPIERALDPTQLDGLGVDVQERPLFDGAIDMEATRELGELYDEVLEGRGAAIAQTIAAMVRRGAAPAVFFCSAGKDRTGLIAGIILSAVGVRDSDVAAEYALTADAMEGEFRSVVAARAVAAGLSEQAFALKLGAPPELMLKLLSWIRERHGDTGSYLLDHGLAAEDLKALRTLLVEHPESGGGAD